MKSITRQELYDKIWSITKSKTAKELGIAFAELTKICVENEIPTPTSTYWQQLSWKEDVVKTPLPNPEQNTMIELPKGRNSISENKKPRMVNSYAEILDQTLIRENEQRAIKKLQKDIQKGVFYVDFTCPFESWSPNVGKIVKMFPVPEILKSRREIILQTKAYFRLSRLSWAEREKHPDYAKINTYLNISVGKDLVDRALRLFDTLISIFESLGGKMTYEGSSTSVEFGGVKIPIRLSERSKRIDVPEEERRYGNRYQFVASGLLRIHLSDRFNEKTIEDTSTQKLEDKLDVVVKKCFELVRQEYEWREYRKQQEIKRQQEEEKRRLEEEARRQIEKLREEERTEVREVFSLLRREIVCSAIGSLAKKLDTTEDSTIGKVLLTKLHHLQNIFNPLRKEPVSGYLSEADIDDLAQEFIEGKKTDNKGR